jgi:hypothetical protein
MPPARIFFEHQGLIYGVGRVRLGVALRATSSREFCLLQPFSTVQAAEQLCAAMARAQIMVLAPDEPAQVDGPRTRKRRGGRRRRPRVAPAAPPMSARRPPVSPLPGAVSQPSQRVSASSSPHEGSPSDALPRRPSSAHTSPSPETLAQLDAALHRIEKTLP